MLKPKPISLNTTSYEAVISILKKIRDHPFAPIINNIYIDTVGDPTFYKNQLIKALGADYGNFIIEKKADATYKVVSAASIVAKVTRDRIVSNWQWKEPCVKLDKNYGSGYPSDETCVNWYITYNFSWRVRLIRIQF